MQARTEREVYDKQVQALQSLERLGVFARQFRVRGEPGEPVSGTPFYHVTTRLSELEREAKPRGALLAWPVLLLTRVDGAAHDQRVDALVGGLVGEVRGEENIGEAVVVQQRLHLAREVLAVRERHRPRLAFAFG
jgi:hypothetical protein